MPEVPFKDFQNLDIRVGRVIGVAEIENSKNLLKLQVDFGAEQRQAVAGLKNHYRPEELLGKDFVFILNLERKKLMGFESQCMILAADDGSGTISLLQPTKEIAPGSRVR